MTRFPEEWPSVAWSDQEIVRWARPRANALDCPVYLVPLIGSAVEGRPDTAEVRFNGRAPGPQISVRRYYRGPGENTP
jgi:hypothetical protein